jgi:hypothetical protein
MINGHGLAFDLTANSVVGGLASVAGGGKFVNGAVTGAFGYLFSPAFQDDLNEVRFAGAYAMEFCSSSGQIAVECLTGRFKSIGEGGGGNAILLRGGSAPDTFYRTMSQEQYEQLLITRQIPATGETFVSPNLQYAKQYDGVTVQFTMQPGTTAELLGIGVRNVGLNEGAFGGLPVVQSGWASVNAFFKLEGSVVNIGLGNGAALNTFNKNITSFSRVP